MGNIHDVLAGAIWVFAGVATVMVALVVGYFVVRRMGRMRGF